MLTKALQSPQLLSGVRYGVAAAALAAIAGTVWRGWRGRPAPVAGGLFAGAFLLALADRAEVPAGLVMGVAILAGAGVLHMVHPLLGTAAAVPGAAITAASVPGGLGTAVAVVTVVTIVAGGALVMRFEQRWARSGMAPVLLALTVAGTYATVPETRRVLVLVGAALPLPLLGWPLPLASIGPAGWYVVPGVLMWTALVDGATRPGAVVGAAGCLGLFVIEPLARAVRGATVLDRLGLDTRPWLAVPPVAAVHLGVVYVAGRVAGLRPDAGTAAAIVLGTVALAVGFGVALAPDRDAGAGSGAR